MLLSSEATLFYAVTFVFGYFIYYQRNLAGALSGRVLLTVGLAGIVLATGLNAFIVPVLADGIDGYQYYQLRSMVRYSVMVPSVVVIGIGLIRWLPTLERLKKEISAREIAEKAAAQRLIDIEALRVRSEQSEALLKDAIESIEEAFIVYDETDRIVIFNEKHRRLFKSVENLMEPGVRYEDLLRAQLDSGQLGDFEDKEGWIANRVKQHRNPSGPVVQYFADGRIFKLSEYRTTMGGIVAIRTDITDAENREKELREIQQNLAEAQSVGAIGSWCHDFKGKYYTWSDETARIMGYPVGIVTPSIDAYRSRVHPDDLAKMDMVVDKAVRAKEEYEIDYRMIQPDGIEVFVRERGRTKFHENGRPVEILGTLQDITRQSEIERSLHDALHRAELAVRAKSEFLASMSHELRTPLNAIIGFSDILDNQVFGPMGNERYLSYSKDINSAGRHLLSLVNDLLDLSRMETGDYGLDESTTNPSKLVKGAIAMLHPMISQREIDLQFDPEKYLFDIIADERQLTQVIINVISNAVKFTPRGGLVSVTIHPDDEEWLDIAVCDTGPGIAVEEVELVLSPFGRTERSSNLKIEGVGLGLPISKLILERHGGDLVIDSRREQGACVRIRLPKDREIAPERVSEKQEILL